MKNNNIQLTQKSLQDGFESMFKEVNTFGGKSGEEFRNCIATAANGMLTTLELTGEVTDTQSLVTRQKNLQIVAAATDKISDGDHVFYNGLYKWLMPFTGAGRASGQERVAFISMIKTIIINEINKVAEVINNKLIALDDTVKTKDRITEQLVAQNQQMQAQNQQMQSQNQQIIEIHQQEKAQIAEMATAMTNELHLTHEQLKQMDQKVEEKEAQLKEKDETIAKFNEQFEALNTKLANQSVFYSRLQEQNTALMQQSMLQSQIGVNQVKDLMNTFKEEIKEMIISRSMTSSKSSKHSKYNTNNKADQKKILEGVNLVKSQEVDLKKPRKVSEVESEYCNDNRSNSYTDMLKKQENQSNLGMSNISIID